MNAPAGLLILVAADDPDTVTALAEVFHAKGYKTLGAYDGPTALALAELAQPDLLLLDEAMPGMDAYEVARECRNVPVLHDAVIVCLCADARDEGARASQAGCDLSCVKPVHFALLDELVERTLQLRREHLRLGEVRAALLAEIRTNLHGLRSYWYRYHE